MPIVPFKGQFSVELHDKNMLPQVQQLNKFIIDNNINDVSFKLDSTCHDMIVLIVNQGYQLLSNLRDNIIRNSQYAQQYLYLAVNKFIVYSTTDVPTTTGDYDLKLINYCHEAIKDTFSLIEYTARSDDIGTLGNFVHPVTTMFFKRNG